MEIKDFKQMLRENFETKFKYTKKDGSEREARGTLNTDMVPESAQPKGTQSWETADDIVKYYDLDKEGWRSFHWDQFVDVV